MRVGPFLGLEVEVTFPFGVHPLGDALPGLWSGVDQGCLDGKFQSSALDLHTGLGRHVQPGSHSSRREGHWTSGREFSLLCIFQYICDCDRKTQLAK